MRFIRLLLLLLPLAALADISGMDDLNPNIPKEVQEKLDSAVSTYYQSPSRDKVETVLDIMNSSALLRKKIAWAPTVGFLTVVFADNKHRIFDWMGRNEYNTYAQEVFVTALMHARLPEAASVFAQAHGWSKKELRRLQATQDTVDLKRLNITVPGHIDTLWGAFFASGNPLYVEEIISVLPSGSNLPLSDADRNGPRSKTLEENKKLAESTLRRYAPQHAPVREALKRRISAEDSESRREFLRSILPASDRDTGSGVNLLYLFAGVIAVTGIAFMWRKGKEKHGVQS